MAVRTMSRKLPSLKALRTFEAAARLLSFSRAADELFVPHALLASKLNYWKNILVSLFLFAPMVGLVSRGLEKSCCR